MSLENIYVLNKICMVRMIMNVVTVSNALAEVFYYFDTTFGHGGLS